MRETEALMMFKPRGLHPLPQLKGGKILLEKMHVFGIAILTALTKIK